METDNQVKPPEDLAGYQLIHYGIVQDGDIIVSFSGRTKEWASLSIGMNVQECRISHCFDVYRKMECPKHCDDKPIIVPSGSHDTAKTDDGGKPPLAMLPWKALREVAMVQEYGHKKYHDYFNYKKGLEVGRNLSCAMRHLADFMDGIDLDKESGRSHLSHAACRILFALENLQDGTMIDNRYKKQND